MWNIAALVSDACRVSQAILPDVAELDLCLRASDAAMTPTALHLDAGLRRLARGLDQMATSALDVSCGLQPQVERLWEGLVQATSSRAKPWEPQLMRVWCRASGHIEELSWILSVVAEEAPRQLRTPHARQELVDEQGQRGQGSQQEEQG